MIQFNNTTTKRGLVQLYEKELGINYGDVSGNSDALLEFTSRVNNALEDYLLLWAKSAGTWQADDTNHTTKYPIVTLDIVSGQRDYAFDLDQNSNKIVDISKVLILPSTTATDYVEICPVDELKTEASEILVNSTTGTPYQYGKLANAIFLDPVPDYSLTAGIKMIVDREGSSFSSTDTTKTPGVPVYHQYFYLKPAMEKARIMSLPCYDRLRNEVMKLEGDEPNRISGLIQEFFGRRERDVRKIMTHNKILFI